MMVRKRHLLPNFISPELCKELVFIQKTCGVVGYRPHVFSTTLSHLVATNSAALIMPFIALREKVKEAVEDYFECEFELFIEFTGLISWTKGANIGWHSDDNRNYLKQRHYSAVCYLNTYNESFHGGLFHFQEGEPFTIVPNMGDVLVYSANEDNIHSVDEVTEGERFTMALWFTRDQTHDEDKKLINQLLGCMPRILHDPVESSVQDFENASQFAKNFVPSVASTDMYWVHKGEREANADNKDEQTSANNCPRYDIRVARLASLGLHIAKIGEENGVKCGCLKDLDGVLDKPLKLVYHRHEIPYTFANSMHALQVAQFCEWRGHSFDLDFKKTEHLKSNCSNVSKRQKTSVAAMMHSCDRKHSDSGEMSVSQLQGEIFGLISEVNDKPHVDADDESSALSNAPLNIYLNKADVMVRPWEDYMSTLWTNLMLSLPKWQSVGSLFVHHQSEEIEST